MTKRKRPTLRDLIERYRNDGRPRGTPPISMRQVAADIGISHTMLYQMLRGDRKPSVALAERIADTIGAKDSELAQAFS